MNLLQNKTKILFINYYTFRSEEGEDTDQRIIRHLKNKVKKIIHIIHPLPEFGHRYSYLTIYENGNKSQSRLYIFNGSEWLQYLQHILVTYLFLIKSGIIFDLAIVAANLSLVSILPLRFFGCIKRLVYYSLDFVPQRFPSSLLNWLYHFLSRLSCKYSDINWVMAKQQVEGIREKGINSSNSAPFFLVPIGYETKNINILPANKINFFNIVYSGGFREAYGPQLAIKALPLLINKIPNIRLTLIGAGKYEPELKRLIKLLKVSRYVDFKGFVPKFKDLTNILAQKSIGLAPYAPIPGSNSYFSDPSKIKLYISCGLPVITTNVTTISGLITKTHSGIVIDFSEQALANAVIHMLTNNNQYNTYKNSAVRLSGKFDIGYIIDSAIKKIPD